MATQHDSELRVDRGFEIHLGVYALVAGGVMALCFTRNPEKMWSMWVAGGWGLGVLLHGALAHVPQTRERAVGRTEHRMNKRESRQAGRQMAERMASASA